MGPMAFDIATMAYLYGGLNPNYKNTDNPTSGNNTYTLSNKNLVSTYGNGFTSIFDNGGTDLFLYDGTQAVTIDLRPATIQNEFGGGGFISKIDDPNVFSGLTIAEGTIIENATAGSGNDTFYQAENVSNIIEGNGGNDSVHYSSVYSDYTITDISGDGSHITVEKGGITDILYNIETLVFSDGNVKTNNITPPTIGYSTYSSSIASPGITINSSNTVVTDDITITTNNQLITRLEVIINDLQHTWVGDLEITLTNVNTGTSTVLMNLAGSGTWGSSGDNFIDTILSDSATTSINSISSGDSPHTGIYSPSNDNVTTYLSNFDNENINSTWRLTVRDTYPSLDDGLLVKWSLIMYPAEIILVTMTISSSVSSGSTIYQTPITLNFTSTVSTSDFTLSDIVVQKDGITLSTSDYLSNFQGSGSSYSADFSTTTDGLYTFNVPEMSYSNSDGKNNSDSNTFSLQSCVANKVSELLNQEDLPSLVENNSNSIYIGSSPINTNSAISNTSLGFDALKNIVTGDFNLALGYNSSFLSSSAIHNISVGISSLYNNKSGKRNTALGNYTGGKIENGSKNLILGWGSDTNTKSAENQIIIGYGTLGVGDNIAVIGNPLIEALYINQNGQGKIYADSLIQISDRRNKKNITEIKFGLSFINQLKPVSYNMVEDDLMINKFGFIAQDVKEMMDKKGMKINDYNIIHYIKKEDKYKMNYNELIAPLIKSVQELSHANEYLKTENNKLKNQMLLLSERLDNLEKHTNFTRII